MDYKKLQYGALVLTALNALPSLEILSNVPTPPVKIHFTPDGHEEDHKRPFGSAVIVSNLAASTSSVISGNYPYFTK